MISKKEIGKTRQKKFIGNTKLFPENNPCSLVRTRFYLVRFMNAGYSLSKICSTEAEPSAERVVVLSCVYTSAAEYPRLRGKTKPIDLRQLEERKKSIGKKQYINPFSIT
jgi:hypothetical protein